jgi:hypothetical protein
MIELCNYPVVSPDFLTLGKKEKFTHKNKKVVTKMKKSGG